MSQRIPALDSLRGFFLILMTLDHLGGPIAQTLYGAFGFVSAAEGFFFLSGFVAIQVCLRRKSPSEWLLLRARKIWFWHILSVLALSLLVASCSTLGWKLLPGTNLLFSNPFSYFLSTASLVHLPDYLDVLPLYVMLMLLASVAIPAIRITKQPVLVLLAGSTLGWGLAQIGLWNILRSPLPTWAKLGAFDPLAWQWVFFAGAALAMVTQRENPWWKHRLVLPVSALLIGLFFCWKHACLGLPVFSETQFWNSRSSLGPLRIANTLAWVLFFTSLIHKFPKWVDWRFPAFLGRHSLYVFTFHLPLVYLWQFRSFSTGATLAILVPLLLVISLAIPALFHEKS